VATVRLIRVRLNYLFFASDSEPVPEMYANYFRWLETEDE